MTYTNSNVQRISIKDIFLYSAKQYRHHYSECIQLIRMIRCSHVQWHSPSAFCRLSCSSPSTACAQTRQQTNSARERARANSNRCVACWLSLSTRSPLSRSQGSLQSKHTKGSCFPLPPNTMPTAKRLAAATRRIVHGTERASA